VRRLLKYNIKTKGEFREFSKTNIRVLLEIILSNIEKNRLKANGLVKGN
jgi:hypothetical protein